MWRRSQSSTESQDVTYWDGRRTDANENKAVEGPPTINFKRCSTQKSATMIWKASDKSDKKLGN